MVTTRRTKRVDVDVEGALPVFAYWNIQMPVGTNDAGVKQIVDLIVKEYDGFAFEPVGTKILMSNGHAIEMDMLTARPIMVENEDVHFVVAQDWKNTWVLESVANRVPECSSNRQRAAGGVPAATLHGSQPKQLLEVNVSGIFPCFACWTIEMPEDVGDDKAQEIVDCIVESLGGVEFQAAGSRLLAPNSSVEELGVIETTPNTADSQEPNFVVTRDWQGKWVLEQIQEPFVLRSTRPRPQRTVSIASEIGAEVD